MDCQSKANGSCWPKHLLFSPFLGPHSLTWLQPSLTHRGALCLPASEAGTAPFCQVSDRQDFASCSHPQSRMGDCRGCRDFKCLLGIAGISSPALSQASLFEVLRGALGCSCHQWPCFNQVNISQKAEPEHCICKISPFTLGLNFINFMF